MSRYIDLDKAVPIAIQAVVDVVGHGISQVDAVRIAERFEEVPTVEILPMCVTRKMHRENATEEFKQFVKEKMVKELGEYLLKNGFIRFSEDIERDLYTILGLIQIVDGRSENERT